MKLALQLSAPLHDDFAAATYRLGQITLAPDVASCDAVVTDDPHTAHMAACQGRHVLLHNWESEHIRSIDRACRQARATFMPSHPWRYRPSVQALNQNHRAGDLGEPGLIRIHRWCADTVSDIRPDSILPELDLILWMFGSSHEAVHAVQKSTKFLQIHLGFAGGGMALADYAWGVAGGYESFCLIGATGAAYADDHHNMNLLFTSGPVRAIKTSQGSMHVHALLEEFVLAIEEDRAPAVTATDTLLALNTAGAALKAAQAPSGSQ